jgi:hypothetical protein
MTNNTYEAIDGAILELPTGWTFVDFSTATKEIIPSDTQLWVSPEWDGAGENLGQWTASLIDIATDEEIDFVEFTQPTIEQGNDWFRACIHAGSMKW